MAQATFTSRDKLFRLILTASVFRNITQIVRILPPPRAWISTISKHAKPQYFSDSRDSKNDSNLSARREIQRRRRHAPSCMGATELQSNWPEMRKTLGKPGFCSGEDRNRTTYESPGDSQYAISRGADSGALFETLGNLNTSTVDPIDSDLATIIHSWPTLDTTVKKSILEMISRCL